MEILEVGEQQFVIGDRVVSIGDLVQAYKAMGPDEQSRLVREAWYDRYHKTTISPVDTIPDSWVKEVLDDQVIIDVNGVYYAYPYEMDGDEVTFGEAVKVKVTYVPAGEQKSMGSAIKTLREENGGVVVGGDALHDGHAGGV